MKKLVFIMFFVNINLLVFSQKSEDKNAYQPIVKLSETALDFRNINENVNTATNNLSVKNTASDTSSKLMTIQQLIKASREGVVFISNEELIKRINANPKLILLDVRGKDEYDAGHLKGATWLDRGVAEFTLARTLPDPFAEIIVYCLKGNRSALVVKALKNIGYKNVKSYLGLEEWIKADLPIYNFLGEIKVVKLREINAASNPVEYYLDKKTN